MAIAGELVSSRVSPERVNRSQVWNLSQNWLPAISVNQSTPQTNAPSGTEPIADRAPPEPLPPRRAANGSPEPGLLASTCFPGRVETLPRRGKVSPAHRHPANTQPAFGSLRLRFFSSTSPRIRGKTNERNGALQSPFPKPPPQIRDKQEKHQHGP